MRRVTFSISLFLHALLIAILVWISPSESELKSTPRIITVVPVVSLPPGLLPKEERDPPLRVPVYVRPFTIPGDGCPPGGGKGLGGRGPASSSLAAKRRQNSNSAPTAVGPARAEKAPVPEQKDPVIVRNEAPPGSGRLKFNPNEYLRKWRLIPGRNEPQPPPGFGGEKPVTALPFGSEGGGGIPGMAGEGGLGASASGGGAFFDSRGYDITPWAKRVVYRIKRNWLFPSLVAFGLQGQVEILTVIDRSGRIVAMRVAKSSPVQPFNQSALNALELSVPFPPLPDDFPNPTIAAYLIFRFN